MRFTRIKSINDTIFGNVSRNRALVISLYVVVRSTVQAQVTTCDMDGIGSAPLVADVDGVTITGVSTGTAGQVPYCLVKVLVPEAINIWVGLPMKGMWNQRLQSEGGGVYCGSVGVPASMATGYVGITTDTGHIGKPPVPFLDGSFAMLEPGYPNIPLQIDFSYRSLHLMAVIGKQLIQAFYGQQPLLYAYWNGCSTGGRQELAMAQRYPEDSMAFSPAHRRSTLTASRRLISGRQWYRNWKTAGRCPWLSRIWRRMRLSLHVTVSTGFPMASSAIHENAGMMQEI